jgi:HEPN domain-containing protein
MDGKNIDIKKTFEHWITTSDKDFDTMIHLFETKDYQWSLFIGHIVIEKLLKAFIVKATSEHAPFTHDLRRLGKLTGLEFQDMHYVWLDTITTFNINTRYDSYKQAFYLRCTPEYTGTWINNIKTLRQWIKTKL